METMGDEENHNLSSSLLEELMESEKELDSILEFTEYLKQYDLSWLPLEPEGRRHGWIFWNRKENRVASSSSSSSEQNKNCSNKILRLHSCYQLSSEMEDRIIQVLEKLTSKWDSSPKRRPCLVQFWGPKETKTGIYLSALGQPFALSSLYKSLCLYRKHCVDSQYYAEEIGPLARVFTYGWPESSPDVRLYSEQEYAKAMMDLCVQCGLTQQLVVPVFDSISGKCVGVLELLYSNTAYSMGSDFEIIQQVLKVRKSYLGDKVEELQQLVSPFGKTDTASVLLEAIRCIKDLHIQIQEALSLPHLVGTEQQNTGVDQNLDSTNQIVFYPVSKFTDIDCSLAWKEMKNMLKLAIEAPELQLVQVWVPQEKERVFMVRAAFIHDVNKVIDCVEGCDVPMLEFLEACNFHVLRRWIGIAGKALASEKKMVFGKNLMDCTTKEHPLAHYMKRAQLNACFSISLQSSYTGIESPFVLEFYFYKSCQELGYVRSFLGFLFPLMKEQLKSFKVSSGQEFKEELIDQLHIHVCHKEDAKQEKR